MPFSPKTRYSGEKIEKIFPLILQINIKISFDLFARTIAFYIEKRIRQQTHIMFFFALIIFLLFSIAYTAITLAVVYHFRLFTLAIHQAPHNIMRVFVVISAILWLAALYFLLNIPS